MALIGRGVALFKKGWNEVPELIGGGFMMLIGAGLTFYVAAKNDALAGKRPFKKDYVVYRDDDPIAKEVPTWRQNAEFRYRM